jgi:hypothetical protein
MKFVLIPSYRKAIVFAHSASRRSLWVRIVLNPPEQETTMDRVSKKSILTYAGTAALAIGVLTACGEKADTALGTPTSTIQSYISVANSIQASREINISLVKDALKCFSKTDREWFQENYKTFPMDELSGNAAMAVSEPVLRGRKSGSDLPIRHRCDGESGRLLHDSSRQRRPELAD